MKAAGLCKSIKDYNFRSDENGNPVVTDCQKNLFVTYYTTTEALAVFEDFYENKYGLQDKFVAYWDAVSSKFAQNRYVIGFDPINEPLPSSFMRDPFLIQPRRSNKY